MSTDDAIAKFIALSAVDQLNTLADYAHKLTILARGTYVPGTEDIANPARLRLFNEVQHRVTGHIRHLLSANVKRYPDDVLVHIVVAEGDGEMLSGFGRALRVCS